MQVQAATWHDILKEHDTGSSLVVVVDHDFTIRAASRSAFDEFGIPMEDGIGLSAIDLIHPADAERATRAFGELHTHVGLRPPDIYRLRNGNERFVAFDVSGESLPGGIGVVFRLTVLNERRRAEMLALEQVEVLELLGSGASLVTCLEALANMSERHIDCALTIVHTVDEHGRLAPVTTGRIRNKLRNRYLDVDATSPEGNLGEAARRGVSHTELNIVDLPHWSTVAGSLAQSNYTSCVTTPAYGANGEPVGFIEVLRPSVERPDNGELAVHSLIGRLMGLIVDRLSFEQSLSNAAYTDALTGLGNRRSLQQGLDELALTEDAYGLLGIDLDQFAWINNNLGHAAGDQLLIEVSRRISAALPMHSSVYRPGGDEFVVVVPGERRSADLLDVAHGILAAMKPPVSLATTQRLVNLSIGIATSSGDPDPHRVLARADAAMYAAKRDGGAGVRLFSEPIGQQMMRRMALADELRGAIANDELRLIYQPILDLKTLEVQGAEALVRWEHPRLGLLGPDEFVPVAEESSLILELDSWVIDSAVRQLRTWLTRREEHAFTVWVNLSARTFLSKDLIPTVTQLTDGLDRANLGLEITERDPIDDQAAAAAVFAELRSLGYNVAIDDFGTGRASLSRFADFDVSTVKIDRSFIRNMADSARYRTLVQMILGMSREFGVSVTAEGIERMEELEQLQAFGCHRGQGFLFSRPLIPDDFEKRFGTNLMSPWIADGAVSPS